MLLFIFSYILIYTVQISGQIEKSFYHEMTCRSTRGAYLTMKFKKKNEDYATPV